VSKADVERALEDIETATLAERADAREATRRALSTEHDGSRTPPDR
jgi:hypothetical protein